MKWNSTVRYLFSELNILTVYSLYILETVVYTKNNYIQTMPSHKYNTRNKVVYEDHNLELFKKKTTYMGLKFLNKIPLEIKQINDKNTFKSKLKEFLLRNPMYSLEEFFDS